MNSLSHVISIVTKLPPAIDGVGDYALNLARQLRKDFNIQTRFIVGDPTWDGAEEIEGFPVRKVPDRSSAALLGELAENASAPILLQYVGYGYAHRGCPLWLVQGLHQWKNSDPNRLLVTMFHELYASGYPWTTSSFWLSPLQKNLATRLLQISSHCITSNQNYVDLSTNLLGVKSHNIISIPIFSNVGEPKAATPLAERSKRIVIFGHKNSRIQVYQQCLRALETICERLNIQEIYDIGVRTGLELSTIANVPVVEKGITESQEISKILQNSIVGFLNFPPPLHLAKSGIFSAYCAHGVVPCMMAAGTKPIDNIEADKHYWSYQKHCNPLTLEVGQEIAEHAYAHYQGHNLQTHANIFATCLGVNK